jgi:hypothetical protein
VVVRALGQFTDVVGSGVASLAFVLALAAFLGALSGGVSDTRARNTRPRRRDARLRMVGLGGAVATLALWAFSLA